MRKVGSFYNLVALLIASSLALSPQQPPDANTHNGSEPIGPKPALDKATYLRLRMQLVHGFAERPPCESDTPSGHAEEVQRALRVFAEIRKDTETFQAALQQLGLKDVKDFSDDQKLLLYRQYENLTSIHLEPLRKNEDQDTYALTFVPNYEPHCDPYAGTTVKSRWVNVDQQGRVTVGAFSVPANSMPETGAGSGVPHQANVPHRRTWRRLLLRNCDIGFWKNLGERGFAFAVPTARQTTSGETYNFFPRFRKTRIHFG